jgi:hypothetical protein
MKTLACLLRRHVWETQIDQGEKYQVCAVCGRTPRISKRADDMNWAARATPGDGGRSGGGTGGPG